MSADNFREKVVDLCQRAGISLEDFEHFYEVGWLRLQPLEDNLFVLRSRFSDYVVYEYLGRYCPQCSLSGYDIAVASELIRKGAHSLGKKSVIVFQYFEYCARKEVYQKLEDDGVVVVFDSSNPRRLRDTVGVVGNWNDPFYGRKCNFMAYDMTKPLPWRFTEFTQACEKQLRHNPYCFAG